MRYANTTGERSISELATRLFGTRERTAAGREAAKALLDANPELERIDELPRGTLVEVPDVKRAKAAKPLRELTDAVGATAVRSVRTGIDSFGDALEEIVDRRVEEATLERKILKSAQIKRAARGEKALSDTVKLNTAEVDAELNEARALRREQKRALAAMADELDQLLELMKPQRLG